MPKPYHTPRSERDEVLGQILDREMIEIALENVPAGPAFDADRRELEAKLAEAIREI